MSALPWAQTTIYVDKENCPNTGSGTAADPFCAIQDGINASAQNDIVLVNPGTYSETLDFQGKGIIVRSAQGPAVTTIDSPVASSVVSFTTGETPLSVLEGFTLTGPYRGIVCDGASPTIRNNVIDGFAAAVRGAGIAMINGAAPVIDGNVFSNNTSLTGATTGRGGALYSQGASPTICRNIFSGNSASLAAGGFGGAIFIGNSTATIENNLFTGNTVCDPDRNRGGAIYSNASVLTIVGNTFTQNEACDGPTQPGRGGALYLDGGTSASICNTILWNNQGGDGHEVFITLPSSVNWMSTDVDPGSNAVGGLGSLSGVAMNVDPMFVDASNGDFHLSAGSPLIDSGMPAVTSMGYDPDLDPRVLDGGLTGRVRIDIGYDEYNPARLTVTGTSLMGTTLTFNTTGPAGMSYCLAYSADTGNFFLRRYGSLLIDLKQLFNLSFGFVPGTDPFFLPNDPTIAGLDFFVQALVQDSATWTGAFTNRLDFVVH